MSEIKDQKHVVGCQCKHCQNDASLGISEDKSNASSVHEIAGTLRTSSEAEHNSGLGKRAAQFDQSFEQYNKLYTKNREIFSDLTKDLATIHSELDKRVVDANNVVTTLEVAKEAVLMGMLKTAQGNPELAEAFGTLLGGMAEE